jgi:hypothetical protein
MGTPFLKNFNHNGTEGDKGEDEAGAGPFSFLHALRVLMVLVIVRCIPGILKTRCKYVQNNVLAISILGAAGIVGIGTVVFKDITG